MRKQIGYPVLAAALGLLGLVARRWQLATAFEPDTGLPIPHAPATYLMTALMLAAALLFLLLCRRLPKTHSSGYGGAFSCPCPAYAALGVAAALALGGAGLLRLWELFTPGSSSYYLGQLGNNYYGSRAVAATSAQRMLQALQRLLPAMPSLLLALLCLVACLCLIGTVQKNYRARPFAPRSAQLLAPPYACCLWLVVAYQAEAGDPFLQDYLWSILAIIATLLALYHMASFSFERAKPRGVAFFSMLGVTLTLASLTDGADLSTHFLQLFSILFLFASLYALLGNLEGDASHPTHTKEDPALMANQKGKYYITTPIYYPSDKLHIGHTYCTVATDTMARYKRLQGYDVLFLTGTDEHGQKIEEKAKAAGITPKAFVDHIVAGEGGILSLWKLMNISNDRFIRTTDDYHVAAIQKIFKALYDKGEIYKGKYVGKYCTPCESFWTESQLADGKCPDCGREVQGAEEEAYFFRLSAYRDRILALYSEQPDFLEPVSRMNEMVNNFLKPGLEDLCVSRTSFTWGVPVDFDAGHVVYVWVDALSNYITALGYENDRHDDFDKYWPADVHFVGKEIVRFHAIIWPALLMALDLPLPKKVFGHGWLLLDGGKMSKSKGNVVDPVILANRYGVDSLRYFLLREFPFGSDGSFSNELLISRINTDLANDLGNLLSRTTAMVFKYFDGTLPADQRDDPLDRDLIGMGTVLRDGYEAQMEKFAFQGALTEVFRVISRANKYIDETAPWVLAKNEADRPRLARVLYNLLESLRLCGILLTPFMPDACAALFGQIGADTDLTTWDAAGNWGLLPAAATVQKGENLFPRIDMEQELRVLEELSAPAAVTPSEEPPAPPIAFDDFLKVKFKVCKVLACEAVPKSEKLLKFRLDDGSGTPRQILSGIAKFYRPEDLLGKTVVACVNLAPRKMMGQESCGMLISAEQGENLSLLILDDAIPAGADLC